MARHDSVRHSLGPQTRRSCLSHGAEATRLARARRLARSTCTALLAQLRSPAPVAVAASASAWEEKRNAGAVLARVRHCCFAREAALCSECSDRVVPTLCRSGAALLIWVSPGLAVGSSGDVSVVVDWRLHQGQPLTNMSPRARIAAQISDVELLSPRSANSGRRTATTCHVLSSQRNDEDLESPELAIVVRSLCSELSGSRRQFTTRPTWSYVFTTRRFWSVR